MAGSVTQGSTRNKPTMARDGDAWTRGKSARELVDRHGALEVLQAVVDVVRQDGTEEQDGTRLQLADEIEAAIDDAGDGGMRFGQD